MSKKELLAYVIAILETLNETKGASSGILYTALMSRINLDQYNQVIGLMKSSGFIEVNNHFVTLSLKGSDLLTGQK